MELHVVHVYLVLVTILSLRSVLHIANLHNIIIFQKKDAIHVYVFANNALVAMHVFHALKDLLITRLHKDAILTAIQLPIGI